jgi:hypothetical protein
VFLLHNFEGEKEQATLEDKEPISTEFTPRNRHHFQTVMRHVPDPHPHRRQAGGETPPGGTGEGVATLSRQLDVGRMTVDVLLDFLEKEGG